MLCQVKCILFVLTHVYVYTLDFFITLYIWFNNYYQYKHLHLF